VRHRTRELCMGDRPASLTCVGCRYLRGPRTGTCSHGPSCPDASGDDRLAGLSRLRRRYPDALCMLSPSSPYARRAFFRMRNCALRERLVCQRSQCSTAPCRAANARLAYHRGPALFPRLAGLCFAGDSIGRPINTPVDGDTVPAHQRWLLVAQQRPQI